MSAVQLFDMNSYSILNLDDKIINSNNKNNIIITDDFESTTSAITTTTTTTSTSTTTSTTTTIISTGFEGVEKKLEIDFVKCSSHPEGLRLIPRERWEEILNIVRCKILSCTRNDFFDSYVLSESSFFVYPYKVILKTCGTTILLQCLEKLLEIVKEFITDTTVEFLFFSRRNFLYPQKQLFPHHSFDNEVEYLKRIFGNDGEAYVFGPSTGHHWHLYLVDYTNKEEITSDVTLEIMMTDLDRSVMEQFYRRSDFISHKEITKSTGISELLPGSITDEFMFDPQGYSMNGLLEDAYFTIHITPEPQCAFVSFETNIRMPDYTKLIGDVVTLFKPGRFTVSLFADTGALCGPTSFNGFIREIPNHKYKTNSYNEFEGQYNVTVCNYESRTFSSSKS